LDAEKGSLLPCKSTHQKVTKKHAQEGVIDCFIEVKRYAAKAASIDPENDTQLPLLVEGIEALQQKEGVFYFFTFSKDSSFSIRFCKSSFCFERSWNAFTSGTTNSAYRKPYKLPGCCGLSTPLKWKPISAAVCSTSCAIKPVCRQDVLAVAAMAGFSL
jgi:hypothetical protein